MDSLRVLPSAIAGLSGTMVQGNTRGAALGLPFHVDGTATMRVWLHIKPSNTDSGIRVRQ